MEGLDSSSSGNAIVENLEKDDVELKLTKVFEKVKKSVQFADGIKPGEGTDFSGNEGDMPSPPPPVQPLPKDDLTMDVSKKLRVKKLKKKHEKKPPKVKKKIKVFKKQKIYLLYYL